MKPLQALEQINIAEARFATRADGLIRIIRRSVLAWLITQYVRLVACTGRWSFIGFDALDDQLARTGPVLFVFWHGQSFMMPLAFPRRGSRIATVTSAHEDGRLAASIARRFGIGSVPLSSRGGNIAGHRALLAARRERMSICVAGDGSRGPVYRLRPGIMRIARSYRGRVALVAYACTGYVQFGSWDRFRLPLRAGCSGFNRSSQGRGVSTGTRA